MAKKFLDNTGLSHLIDLIQGMPDDQTIGYTTEAGLRVLDGGITPDKISSLQQLRYEMGLGNTLGALPIENGGTGLTSEAAIKEWLESLLDLSGGGGGAIPYNANVVYSDTMGTGISYPVSIDNINASGFTKNGNDYFYSNGASGLFKFDFAGKLTGNDNVLDGGRLYLRIKSGKTTVSQYYDTQIMIAELLGNRNYNNLVGLSTTINYSTTMQISGTTSYWFYWDDDGTSSQNGRTEINITLSIYPYNQ